MKIPEEDEGPADTEAHVAIEHGGVSLEERDEGGGEGGELLLVALGHLGQEHHQLVQVLVELVRGQLEHGQGGAGNSRDDNRRLETKLSVSDGGHLLEMPQLLVELLLVRLRISLYQVLVK